MPTASSFDSEVRMMIELVDADFDHPTSSLRFDVLSRGRGPALFGLVFIIFATVLLSTVSQGAPQDIKLSTCALVIAADALAFTLILATESAPRGRLIEGSAHFKRLRNATIEPL